ncbi:phosphate transport regulator [Vibrio astriarenae]|nr:phosphate transport regulator [Vibrio sp. C7]
MRDQNQVRDHAHKVIFVESEADRISTRMKQKVFSSELELAQKIHIRYFIERIDNVANSAEDIADSLVIYAIKRSL